MTAYILSPRAARFALRVLFAMLLAVTCAFTSSARAGEMELEGLVLDNEAGNITVRFGVAMTGMYELAKELDAGTTVVLSCEASVHRRTSFWPDKNLASGELVSVLTKDQLADEYVLSLPGEDAPRRNKLLPVLLGDVWSSLSMDLGPWKALAPGNDYRLDLKISMDRTDVPVWLRYVVFFWSFDVCPSVGYQLEFSY